MNGSDGVLGHVQDLARIGTRVRPLLSGGRSDVARWGQLRNGLHAAIEKRHRAWTVAAARDAWKAVIAATIIAAEHFARVVHHQVREADHMDQRKREHDDASEGHELRIARPRMDDP